MQQLAEETHLFGHPSQTVPPSGLFRFLNLCTRRFRNVEAMPRKAPRFVVAWQTNNGSRRFFVGHCFWTT